MSEENIDTALFTVEQARQMLLGSGELVEPRSMFGPVLGGLIIGAGLGAVGGYFFAKRKLGKVYNEIAENEIADMREHYQDKVRALEGHQTKPDLEELVKEKGYSSEQPPMAVTPPDAVVEAAKENDEDLDFQTISERNKQDPTVEEHLRDFHQKQSDPNAALNETQRIFEQSEIQPIDGWDYSTERARRSPLRPYVIHLDEKDEYKHYDFLTFSYYEEDDVLANEEDEPIPDKLRNDMVGEDNLSKFGHGSGHASTVFVRNDKMETVFEIVRSPNSFEEEVTGFHHDDSYPRERRRKRFDDDE